MFSSAHPTMLLPRSWYLTPGDVPCLRPATTLQINEQCKANPRVESRVPSTASQRGRCALQISNVRRSKEKITKKA